MDTSQGAKTTSSCSKEKNIEASSKDKEEAVRTEHKDSAQTKSENGENSAVQSNVDILKSAENNENDDKSNNDTVCAHPDCEDAKLETNEKETIEILNVELVVPSSHAYKTANTCVEQPTAKHTSDCNMENPKQILDNRNGTEINTNEVQNVSNIDVNDLLDGNHASLANTVCDNSEKNFVELVFPSTNDSSCLQTVYDIMGNAARGQIHDKKNVGEHITVINDDCDSSSSSSSKCETVEIGEFQMETNEVETDLAQPRECFEHAESQNTSTEAPKTSGLSLLAQYESCDDDDTDSVIEVPLRSGQEYRNQVVEINSDSDSDDSSDSSDVEYLNELRKTIEKRIEIADDDEGDDEDQEDKTGKRKPQQKLRVKGELLLEDLPPIQDLKITVPENDCIEFGKIHSIVDQLVLVSALPNSILLDLETVIFLEKGQKVLGEVFDVLGQVADPLYCVRFNSNDQIKERDINIGDIVYVAPKTQYTQYVILSNLMRTKGSDASWENDMEPPPRFLDYSDDEQEQLAKRQQRNKDRPNDNDDPSKRQRTEADDDAVSASSSYQARSQQRSRYEQKNNRGGPAGPSFVNHRPRFNGPPQYQPRNPNHHRSSWHSNYYPQQFSPQPRNNYRMHLSQNQSHSPQAYRPNMPAHVMPPVRHMSYPPPQLTQYAASPPFQQSVPQLMPNTFSIRPPTLQGFSQHNTSDHQYISAPPPPPGS